MSDPDVRRRLERLESRVERHQRALLDRRTATSSRSDRTETVETERPGGGGTVPVTRRDAVKAGGLLALLGLGARTAAANPQGQVGSPSDPLAVLYAEEINGGVTGGTGLTDLAGTALAVDGGALGVADDAVTAEQVALSTLAGPGLSVVDDALGFPRLPRYDVVGDDPKGTIDAMGAIFGAEPRWGDPAPAHERAAAYSQNDPAFYGGVAAPTGEVIFAPYVSSDVGIYDPATRSYTSGPTHGEGLDVFPSAFSGAALAPTGEVIFAPANSDHVGIYDPVSRTYTSGPAHGEGGNAFSGAAVAPTGEVVFGPNISTHVGVYDPVAGTYTSGPAHREGRIAFEGAVLGPTGDVVFVPRSAGRVGIYDPEARTFSAGPAHGEGDSAFFGGALAPTGEVVFAPSDSTHVGLYDPVAGTYTSGPAHGEGETAFAGATVVPTGEVVFAPAESDNVGIYDPLAETYTSGPSHGSVDRVSYIGAALAPTGEAIFAPHYAARVGATSLGGTIDQPSALHPLVNGL